jgi:hypothetical protein
MESFFSKIASSPRTAAAVALLAVASVGCEQPDPDAEREVSQTILQVTKIRSDANDLLTQGAISARETLGIPTIYLSDNNGKTIYFGHTGYVDAYETVCGFTNEAANSRGEIFNKTYGGTIHPNINLSFVVGRYAGEPVTLTDARFVSDSGAYLTTSVPAHISGSISPQSFMQLLNAATITCGEISATIHGAQVNNQSPIK